jgi:hypothetical protein
MEYLNGIIDTLTSIYRAAHDSPTIFFPIFIFGCVLIWIKWSLIAKGTKKAAKANYEGWITDAIEQDRDLQTVLVMKPIKLLRVAIYSLLFFGGGALFYWMVVLPKPDASTKDWLVFGIMLAFSTIGLWMLWLSFTRITLFSDRIEKTSPLRKRFIGPLIEINNVKPISKTIAGGIYVYFSDGRRLRIIARMSGYRQLLERLSKDDPKLRMMTNLYTRQAQKVQ